MKNLVAARVPRYNMDTVSLIKKMAAFRPVSSDVAAVNKLVVFLRDYLKHAGIYTSIEKKDGRNILYASTMQGKKAGVLFNAHLDVVPADDAMFNLKEKNGWLMGRGSSDCLGNCAVLANMLVACAGKPGPGVVFSTDEETGGDTTAFMVGKGYAGNMVVVMDVDGYSVCFAQKGILALKLTARGKACHGSQPWLGDNAIEKIIEAYPRIKAMFPVVKKGDEWRPTVSPNIIHAGSVFNRVPDTAELMLDIRITEKESPAKIISALKKNTGFKVEKLHESPVVFCEHDNPLVKGFTDHMRKSLKRRISVIRMNGATDTRHFVKLGVPMLMAGVPGSGAHGATERVSIKGLLAYEKMLVEFF